MKLSLMAFTLMLYFFLLSLDSYAAGDGEASEKILVGALLGIAVVIFNVVRAGTKSNKNNEP